AVGDQALLSSLHSIVALLSALLYGFISGLVAPHEIIYRRFFDINDLAAMRVEDPIVFEAVHALPFRLAREGRVTGLRIDHVDGLYDPQRYLHDLQHGWTAAVGEASSPAYVIVEKILGPTEHLPPDWPVC